MTDDRAALQAAGFKLLSTYGAALREPTSAERLEAQQDGRALPALVADPELRQLRLDLRGSGLIALRVSGRTYHETDRQFALGGGGYSASALWGAIRDAALRAPAFSSANGKDVTVLFAATLPDDGSAPVARRLVFDDTLVGTESIQPDGDHGNALDVPTPSLPTLERWLRTGPAPVAPELLLDVATQSGKARDELNGTVLAWLYGHFEPVRPGLIKRLRGAPVVGLSRDEVHATLLRANGWLPADFGVDQLSVVGDLAETGWGDFRHRTKAGYVWEIKRKEGVPLKPIKGAAIDQIDPALLLQFKNWRLGLESHPDRVRARKEQAEIEAARQRQEAHIAAHYGTAAIQAALNTEDYFKYHTAAEARRCKAGDIFGRAFVPLNLANATPEWWMGPDGKFEAGLDPQARYEALVKRFVLGEKVVAA